MPQIDLNRWFEFTSHLPVFYRTAYCYRSRIAIVVVLLSHYGAGSRQAIRRSGMIEELPSQRKE